MSTPVPTPGATPPATTSTGLAPNVAGALAYLLGPVTGILFLVLEKTNSFVRFHAMQSTILWVAWIVIAVGLSFLTAIPVIGWIAGLLLSLVMSLVGLVLWLLLMLFAFQGKEWEVPVVGAFARKQISGAA